MRELLCLKPPIYKSDINSRIIYSLARAKLAHRLKGHSDTYEIDWAELEKTDVSLIRGMGSKSKSIIDQWFKELNGTSVMNFSDVIEDSGKNYYNRILIGTATTGLVRVEWVVSRYGQLIPVNWTNVSFIEPIAGYYPLRYLVADAQNVICHVALQHDFEWILLWEQDTYPDSPDALMKINEYMISEDTPVVSGLYYTKSVHSQPLLFRGRGNGVFLDWKKGDKVWCDGVPTGFLLIHSSIIREMAKDAESYFLRGREIKRIFITPREYFHEDRGELNTISGTSDLDWCTRVMEGFYFEKAGWRDYQKMQFPFLVDTNITCKHINPDGEIFP